MEIRLVTANVVLAARQFNPSIINQLWLVDHDVVRREEFRPGSVFTDMLVNVVTEQFTLFVSPEQLQLVPTIGPGDVQDLISERVGKLVATVPHTPYTACGLNFIWHVGSDNIQQMSRDLFFVPNSPLHQQFEGKDARLGAYLSKPFYDGRLKLDIKPLTLTHNESGKEEERLQMAFNMHWDIERENDVVNQINSNLRRWNDAINEATRIIKSIETVVQ